MKRTLIFVYGLISYFIFFGTFLYLIGFIGNIAVPKSIDSAASQSLGISLLINTVLIGLFALQHSGMARKGFKSWLTNYIPEAAERSTYVLLTSITLMLLFVFWQPLGGTIWSVENAIGSAVIYTFFAMGWLIVLLSTFLINHFELFGLRQVWLNLRGKPYTHLKFGTPWLYRYLRHPLYLGFLFAMWFTPVMTVTHLIFALGLTFYILFAIRLEERDLIDHFGETYARYSRNVPMIIPFTRKKKVKTETLAS